MQTDRVEYHITSGYVQVVAEGHVLPAFWAHPDIGGTFPGLALIHDRWGLTAHVRRLVRQLAQIGYYVIAPDLFGQRQPATPDEARQLAASLGEVGPPYVAAVISALRTHHRCNGDIALVGFDLGGTLALHLAVHHDDLKGAVLFHADPEPYSLLLPAATTPILAFYTDGADDVPAAAVQDFKTRLEATSPEHELIVYEGVGRGFLDPTRPAHDPAAAEDAWKRALAFLEAHLTGPSQAPGIREKRF